MLVTHDRFLLDRVSTAVLGLNGMGGAELFADYWQWEQSARPAAGAQIGEGSLRRIAAESAPPKKKLNYLESREWEQMEKRVLDAEQAGTGSAAGGNAVAGSGVGRAQASRLL